MKTILALVLFIGMAMCSKGIGKIAANNDWSNPFAILGYLLGVFAFAVAYAGFTHRRILFVSNEKQALIALVVIIIVKVAIEAIYSSIKK